MRFKQKQRSAQKTNGSSQSFEALYEEYFDRIYGYIASRLDDVNEVEDVVSDVFLKVMVKLDQFRGDNLTSWLFTIAHHTLMDTYRTRQPQSIELEEDTVADTPSPEQAFILHESQTEMLEHIRALSTRRQEVVTLKFYGQLRNQEIAEVLGISEQSVASHLHRALTDLHARIVPVPAQKVKEK